MLQAAHMPIPHSARVTLLSPAWLCTTNSLASSENPVGANEVVRTSSWRFDASYHLPVLEQENECGKLFVPVIFLFGWYVGGALM